MGSMLRNIMDSDSGAIVVSIMLGLGLAAVFRTACKGGRCVVVNGPPMSDVRDKVYRLDDKCYRYTPYVVPCENAQQVSSSTPASPQPAVS
jgi:hypothetical protein